MTDTLDDLDQNKEDLVEAVEALQAEDEGIQYLKENFGDYAETLSAMSEEIDSQRDLLNATNDFLNEAGRRIENIDEFSDFMVYIDSGGEFPQNYATKSGVSQEHERTRKAIREQEDGGWSRRQYMIAGGAGAMATLAACAGGINIIQNEQQKSQHRSQGLAPHATTEEKTTTTSTTTSSTTTPTTTSTTTSTTTKEPSEIGNLPSGYSQDIPTDCGIGWTRLTQDIADENYVQNGEYFPDGHIDTEEVAFREEDNNLYVAAWDHEEDDWEDILRYGGECW